MLIAQELTLVGDSEESAKTCERASGAQRGVRLFRRLVAAFVLIQKNKVASDARAHQSGQKRPDAQLDKAILAIGRPWYVDIDVSPEVFLLQVPVLKGFRVPRLTKRPQVLH